MPFREILKTIGGFGLGLAPQCRFDRCVFVIGHMRCGSTALSNIICSRAEFSGYGESHVSYAGKAAAGNLALNQITKRRWKANAPYLFDKILHSRLDRDPAPAFFDARAIFVSRDPDASVPSIVALFRAIGSNEYPTLADAASYCADRLTRMRDLWAAFPPARRISIGYDQLIAAPDMELDRLSSFLRVLPGLTNTYSPNGRALGRGIGDPISAHRFSSIVPGGADSGRSRDRERIDGPEIVRARQAYAAFRAITLQIGSPA